MLTCSKCGGVFLADYVCDECAEPLRKTDHRLQEAVSLIQQLQNELDTCLTTYAMTEDSQVSIMRLLKSATLFRRKAA